MRVVHLITGLATGGAERMLQDRIALTRHDVEVVALSVGGPIADQLRAAGVPVHLVGMRSNRDLLAIPALVRLLRRLRPDVVHVHLYRGLLYGRVAARLAGVRAIVATEHSAQADSTEGRRATPVVRGLYRASERLGRLTIAVSATTRDVLVRCWGLRPGRIEVVPNGIDTTRLRITPGRRERSRARFAPQDSTRLVVAAGRLVEGKQFGALIGALVHLDADVHLMIAGVGPEAGRLADRAARLGVAERVHLVGVVDDIIDVLAAGDVFASASTGETYGIAIVEAYVAGLPVVFVDCPALTDSAPGQHDPRRLLTAGTPEALAAAIECGLAQRVGPELVDEAVRAQVDLAAVSRELDDIEATVARGPWRPVRVERAPAAGAATAP